ncbi:MAG: hypothetical protein A2X64_02835 [Ignavibacteria bacterium GWF2_33_9]|nr:MAG: hypothetical protein A2X64_02835 [Ignavibacteria bacterium GWF2_33_9]
MENQELKSIKIPAGKRTYFLDIKKSREEMKYLVITESQRDDKGEYQHNKVIVFQEYFPLIFDELVKLAPDLGVKLYEKKMIDEIRKISPNAYTPWTKEQDEQLELLFCQGKTPEELATIFQRRSGAITSRIKKLELKEKYSK